MKEDIRSVKIVIGVSVYTACFGPIYGASEIGKSFGKNVITTLSAEGSLIHKRKQSMRGRPRGTATREEQIVNNPLNHGL